jgi:hypothetical protein
MFPKYTVVTICYGEDGSDEFYKRFAPVHSFKFIAACGLHHELSHVYFRVCNIRVSKGTGLCIYGLSVFCLSLVNSEPLEWDFLETECGIRRNKTYHYLFVRWQSMKGGYYWEFQNLFHFGFCC